jgi:transcriptional regulator with XRE-family HTH domain
MIRETLAPAKAEIQARFTALGWTQAETARRIQKTPSMLSRWLHGTLTSAVIAKRVERVLARAEARRSRNGTAAGKTSAA